MNRTLLEALAWTLVHFIWQGASIALAAGLASAALRRARPNARYALFGLALAAMAASFVLSFATRLSPGAGLAPAAEVAAWPVPAAGTAGWIAPARAPAVGPDWIAWLVAVWAGGVAVLSVRAAGGWLAARRLASRRTAPVASAVRRAARRIASRLGLRPGAVRVLASTAIDGPAAWGWLRPVVLVPVAALTQLSPGQIELLLVHELAHVRRRDYLVNLLQSAVETVLFYHPAVWWVSRQIRIEREHCCDDLAVEACGDAVGYARTLAALEGLRSRTPAFAIAADGGSLLARIRRLARGGRAEHSGPPAWLGALLPAALVLAATLSVADPSDPAEPTPAPAPASASAPASTPTPAPAPPATRRRAPVTTRTPSPAPVAAVDTASTPTPSVAPVAARASTSSPTPAPAPEPSPTPVAVSSSGRSGSFLGGLAEAKYTNVSVEEIIALKDNGVEPRYIRGMIEAGLGVPSVQQLIRLRQNGVEPEYLAGAVRSGLVRDLSFESTIRLREHGVDVDDAARIRKLGFGPYAVDDVISLRENGVHSGSFRELHDSGLDPSNRLKPDQIIKLRIAGII